MAREKPIDEATVDVEVATGLDQPTVRWLRARARLERLPRRPLVAVSKG